MTDEAQPAQPDQPAVQPDEDPHEGRAFEPTRDRPDPNRIEPRQAEDEDDELTAETDPGAESDPE